MRILAFDVSTRHTGWCVGNGSDYVASGCFSPKGDLWQRLATMANWASRWFIGPAAHKADVIAFEEPRGDHGNMNTNIVLGYANGLVLAPWLSHGWEILPIHIAQIKRSGCHKNALLIAASIAGKPVGEDEADAIGCWLAAWTVLREREMMSDVLPSLESP